MRIMVEHLCFVERKHPGPATLEYVAVEGPALSFKLFACVEESRVVRHVEHRHERDAPRVSLFVAFLDEHGDATVDTKGDLGISAIFKDWDGSRVGVE